MTKYPKLILPKRSLALHLWKPSKGILEVYNPELTNARPEIGLLSIFTASLNLISMLPNYVAPFRAIARPVTNVLSNIIYGKDFNGKEFRPGNYLGNAWRLALGFEPGTDFPIPIRNFRNLKERYDFYDDWAEHYYRARERGDLGDDPYTIELGDDASTVPTYANSTNGIKIQFTPTGMSSILPAIYVSENKGTILTSEDQGVSNKYNLGLNILGVTNV